MILKREYIEVCWNGGNTYISPATIPDTVQFTGNDFAWTPQSLEEFTKLFCSFYPLSIYDPLPLCIWLYLVKRAFK